MDADRRQFTDRLLSRLDKLDSDSLQTYLLRLINEKGFLESVFSTIREAVIVISEDLRIEFVNSAAKPMLGISPSDTGQYIGKFLREIPWASLISTSPLPASSRREIEVFYPEHRFLSFYIMPISSQQTKAISEAPLATLIFEDVTESLQAAETSAENRKVQAITQLAAGVAHELGNPLNSLGIHLQLLQRLFRKMPDNEATRQAGAFLETAKQEVRRLDTIVKNFLNAVRPVPLEPLPINIRQLLENAVNFMRNEIQNRDIAVQMQFPESVPTTYGDGDQLIQAFFNLIKNAVQAMPDGGRLTILVDVDDLYVNIHFMDTGKGISEEEMRQILDPYFTTKSSGTGLGLLIVDRIVRAHGGTLSISGEPGKGASFTVSLPLHVRQSRLLEK